MRVLSLSLEQFRSYAKERIDFAGNVTILAGQNGAGKTNILEAISLLSLTKPFPGAEEQDLLRWETEFYRVRAEAEEGSGQRVTFEVASQILPRKRKVCYVNDVKTPATRMVGRLPTVSFLPQDLDLFMGPPALRRRFLDQLLCQVSPEYLEDLSDYQKLLRQRGALLKKIAESASPAEDLSLWDGQLALRGASITLKRIELIEMLQCTLGEELRSLGESWQDVKILYERKGSARDLGDMQIELLSLLLQNRDRDILLQSTSIGPHRDDWQVCVASRPLSSFASRGQQRTAVLALLFLEVSYVELRRGEKPVILLDDVFSELDEHHQEALLDSLEGHQVIISTAHVPKRVRDAQILEVKEGKVSARVRLRDGAARRK